MSVLKDPDFQLRRAEWDAVKCGAEIHALQGQQFIVTTAALAVVGLHLNLAFDRALGASATPADQKAWTAWIIVISSVSLAAILLVFGHWLLRLRRTALAISIWLELTGYSKWEPDATAFVETPGRKLCSSHVPPRTSIARYLSGPLCAIRDAAIKVAARPDLPASDNSNKVSAIPQSRPGTAEEIPASDGKRIPVPDGSSGSDRDERIGFHLSTAAGVAEMAFFLGFVLPIVAGALVVSLKPWQHSHWQAWLQLVVLIVVWWAYCSFVRQYGIGGRRPTRAEVEAIWRAAKYKASGRFVFPPDLIGGDNRLSRDDAVTRLEEQGQSATLPG